MNPPSPAQPYHVSRCIITGVPLDGELVTAIGTRYDFPCNLTELVSLPAMTHTNIRVGATDKFDDPAIWRAAVKRPDICIEVESTSDAGYQSMKCEAVSTWAMSSVHAHMKSKWFHQIGIHPDLQDRILEPYHARRVTITTLHDDYLARMFATGTAELCLAAMQLHESEPPFNEDISFTQSYEKFLWGGDQLLNEWQTLRYDEALAGRFDVIQHTIDRQ